MHESIRTAVQSALQPHRGGPALDRVINLHGPLDFRGEAGAEAWDLAVQAGNWIAAAIIAGHGYEPPGQEALAQYLIQNRLIACDFNGRPPSHRLWAAHQNISSSDEAGGVAFILEMGKPWPGYVLNTALFLAAQYKKGSPHIRLLCAAGGNIDSRLDGVQTELLASVALSPADLNGLRHDDKRAFLAMAGMDESAVEVALLEHPGATPLILTAAHPYQRRIAPWIECGADVSAFDSAGRTALHWCCRHGNADDVRTLLAKDRGSVDRPDSSGVRPLHAAMRSRNGGCLDALLAAGAQAPEPGHDMSGTAPGAALRLAVHAGVALPSTQAGAEKLLATLPGIEADREGEMRRAAEGGYWELVALLLTAGTAATDESLHAAAKNGDGRSVSLLANAGGNVHSRDLDQKTPLLLACTAGDGDGLVTQALLRAGADPKAADYRGRTCLHLLAASPAPAGAAATALIAAGADVNAADGSGDPPLHDAVRANNLELMQALLDGGADQGFAPLGLCGSTEAVELLLAAKADVSARKLEVAEAALRQAAHGTPEVFAIVLRALKDPSAARDRCGDSLLHQVAWSDKSADASRVQAVLARCPDANVLNNERQTPLMSAAKFGTEAAVRVLLAAGARPARIDAGGRTAADHAAAKGRWKLAEFLAAL